MSNYEKGWFSRLGGWAKTGIILGSLSIAGLFLLLAFRVLFVNYVDSYELGYKYDTRTGQITQLAKTGYVVTPPFLVEVHTIDLRPMQVCINANARVLNCKLVQFNPEGLQLFLSWHGRDDYDNIPGAYNEPSKFNQILMSYAYDGTGRVYPFLTVITELKAQGAQTPNAPIPASAGVK